MKPWLSMSEPGYDDGTQGGTPQASFVPVIYAFYREWVIRGRYAEASV
jgi:hypothetical protein